MKTEYTPIRQCKSFWAWLYFEYRFYHSRGRYKAGVRICGLEVSWIKDYDNE